MTDSLDMIAQDVAARNAERADLVEQLAECHALVDELTGQQQSPSGEPMPIGDLPGWRWLMSEDFDTDVPLGAFPGPYAGRVDVYPPTYFDTSRSVGRPPETQGQYDAARTISVSEGVLRKRLHTEGVRPKVAALVPRLPGVPLAGPWTYQTYGRYAVRVRIPAPMPGYKFAWLTWPQTEGNKVNGELDWPEQNFNDISRVSGFVHYAPAVPAPDQIGKSIACDLRQWHTFVIEWLPGLVRYLLDGVVVLSVTQRIPATPMRWVLQTETHISPTPPAVDVQGDVEIDWLAIWARA